MSRLGDFIRRTKRANKNAGVKRVEAKLTDEQVRALNTGTGAVMFKNNKAILIKKKPKKK